MPTSRYAFGELPVVSKYAVGTFEPSATMAYAVSDYSPGQGQMTYPSTTITCINTLEPEVNLLEKKLKLYENVIEYLVSLLSQEDKEAVKELSELLSRLSR